MLTCALDAEHHRGESGAAGEMEVALGRVWAATKQCPGTAGALRSPDVVISVMNRIKRCLGLGSARSKGPGLTQASIRSVVQPITVRGMFPLEDSSCCTGSYSFSPNTLYSHPGISVSND